MASPHWSLQDAKNSFSALVAAAQKGVPQTVTKPRQACRCAVSFGHNDR